jgi:hypothetical protein
MSSRNALVKPMPTILASLFVAISALVRAMPNKSFEEIASGHGERTVNRGQDRLLII